MLAPYLIKDTEVVDKDGKQTLKIELYWRRTAATVGWDKANLSGKVTVNDITETAQHVPEMREKGADVVVVLAHSGLTADPYSDGGKNSVYYLSEIPGVNAIMFQLCSYAVFPGKDFG